VGHCSQRLLPAAKDLGLAFAALRASSPPSICGAVAPPGAATLAPSLAATNRFPVRYVSNPNTPDRDREEDEAWEILDRLGLNADSYFDG